MKFALLHIVSALAPALALAIAGCELPPTDLGPESSGGAVDKDQDMRGFSWVVDHDLAAMPQPGGSRDLDNDLDFLAEQGISLLVSLTIQSTSLKAVTDSGMDLLHLPVEDFTAPSFAQMREFIRTVDARHADGQAVGVHCTAGLGRSGTMLAAYFVSKGMRAEDALAEIRRLRPGSVETQGQEAAIAAFADSLAADPLPALE